MQNRVAEVTAHEQSLEEWKQRFKAEALRQIGEREAALNDWQAKLEAKRVELEELQQSMEVGVHACIVLLHQCGYVMLMLGGVNLCCLTGVPVHIAKRGL